MMCFQRKSLNLTLAPDYLSSLICASSAELQHLPRQTTAFGSTVWPAMGVNIAPQRVLAE